MTKLTQGEKNRRANLRSLKATGRRNAKVRAATTLKSFLGHVERNNAAAEQAAQARAEARAEHLARNDDRRIMAIIDRRDRIAAGIAKRDAHNAALHTDKVRALAGELLVFAQGSEITSAEAQSPVTAKAYATDARNHRAAANDLLAGIGLTANDIDVDAVVQSILARAA